MYVWVQYAVSAAHTSHITHTTAIFFSTEYRLISIQVRVKKLVPNKNGDIGMKVYYLCQPNTYVIARESSEQQ